MFPKCKLFEFVHSVCLCPPSLVLLYLLHISTLFFSHYLLHPEDFLVLEGMFFLLECKLFLFLQSCTSRPVKLCCEPVGPREWERSEDADDAN